MTAVIRIEHVREFEWNVLAVDDGVDEPVGRVLRVHDAFLTYAGSWDAGELMFTNTGLKFDSLHEAAAALAAASRVV